MNNERFRELSDGTSSKSSDIDETELRNHYPEDNGLLYVQNYMRIFEPSLNPESINSLKQIIWFCKTRRNAPDFVRKAVGFYIDSTGHDSRRTIINDEEIQNHGQNLLNVQVFKSRFPELNLLAERIIYSHYESELEKKEIQKLFKSEKSCGPVFAKLPENEVKKYRLFDHREIRNQLGNTERTQDRAPVIAYLQKILKSDNYKPKLSIRDEAIFDKLQTDFPNFHEVTNYYKAQFRLLEETDKYRINPILMLGSPGIGKSLYTKALAEALETLFTYVDMSSASGGWLLNGLNPSWNNAKNGKISESLIKNNTMNPLVVLDEIEKAGTDKKHDPLAPLYSLLEENTAKDFIDEFIEQPIDASGVIFIACANSLEGIPEPLLTRMKLFNIPDPTKEEKQAIFQKIYDSAISTTSLFSKTISMELLEGFLDKSLRESKQVINDAVANALLEKSKEQLRNMKQTGEVIHIEARHLNLPSKKSDKKFGF